LKQFPVIPISFTVWQCRPKQSRPCPSVSSRSYFSFARRASRHKTRSPTATSTPPATSPAQPSHPTPRSPSNTSGPPTTSRPAVPTTTNFLGTAPNSAPNPTSSAPTSTSPQSPPAATLYIAGPREAHVYLNGHLLADFTSNIDAPINFHVFHIDATQALKPGENTLALEAIRGRGVVSATDSLITQQLAYGEVLAAKIVPAAFGVEAPALIITDKDWRSTTTHSDHWQDPAFDDRTWPAADSLGPIEGNIDFFQWNADAGMFGWPGYMGMSPSLRTYSLQPQTISHIYAAHAQLKNLNTLTQATASQPFTITLPDTPTDAEAPSLLLDFGREVSGRLLVESACACTATLSIAYGESEIEAMSTGLTSGQQGGNYLGTNLLEVPPHGTARGPKSGFRYVRIAFLRGAPVTAFQSIRLEGIYYPVTYQGTFESSDPQLNRIWETGAYTAHLCMQDGIWDAPKRDRGRWVGDLDIAGRVISTVFADPTLTEDTLRQLVPPGNTPVNGIPSYSALWITSLYNLNLHTGDKAFLASQHDNLLHILASMDDTLDPAGLFTNSNHRWLFLDWAPGLYAYTPEARIGTQLQYLRAYMVATKLLTELGDTANAAKYEALTRKATAATQAAFRNPSTGAYGATWQLNALAALTVADPNDPAIWNEILSHIKQDAPTDQTISPYFDAYVLDAMSATSHPRQALDWLRQYWGGMLAEGATSFWESYDLRWPKTNPHLSLQADGTSGYFVSLAHGWSAGPTAWLSENILGITPTSPGYRTVDIRPNLLGLDWARGTVPTPHGPIKISIDRQKGITLNLPAGIRQARLATPDPKAKIFVNGTETTPTASGYILLTSPGQYEISVRNPPPSDSNEAARRPRQDHRQ
jgi:alpha-L-rhamnosidase